LGIGTGLRALSEPWPSRHIEHANLRVISLLARPTRLSAIAFDFSLSAGITGFWFPLLALETEYSVDFVVVDAHIAERPRAGPPRFKN
jgi:hypothetical protein